MKALRFELPAAGLSEAEGVIEGWGDCLALNERPDGRRWAVEILFAIAPGEGEIRERMARLEAAAAVGPLRWSLELVPERDWVAESQRRLPEFRVGRFFLHGSHYRGPMPAVAWPLRIDAGTAFGTGRHETTRLCLGAIERRRRRGRLGRVLDMGCGSGILALAAARAGVACVLAVDNDRVAVATARENARRNRLAGRIRVLRGEGYAGRNLARGRRFDLVLANILARPLCRMAPALKRVLKPGGRAVLAGILTGQEAAVRSAHRHQGLVLEGRYSLNGWAMLVLARKANQGDEHGRSTG